MEEWSKCQTETKNRSFEDHLCTLDLCPEEVDQSMIDRLFACEMLEVIVTVLFVVAYVFFHSVVDLLALDSLFVW